MKMSIGPGLGSVLLLTLWVQLVLTGVHAANGTKNCKLLYNSEMESKALSRVEALANKNFTGKSQNATEDETYTFTFQLCGDAGGVPGAGVIQFSQKSKKTKVIGRYDALEAIGGSDWVMLIYRNGDQYDEHCKSEHRKAIIMISCDRKTEAGPLEVILEQRSRPEDCFYLFELDSSAVCPVIESRLSSGSIILIIAVCLLAVYLIGGFLYQRLVVGAKGMEQFPNYSFWVEVGNLTADGCDFVCRSKNRDEAPAYRGISAEPLEEEPEERDDHLLPM